ncbi:MAG: hypothetical protein AB2693_32030, partial [Candidatus Thiodiazotropha sp.]
NNEFYYEKRMKKGTRGGCVDTWKMLKINMGRGRGAGFALLDIPTWCYPWNQMGAAGPQTHG